MDIARLRRSLPAVDGVVSNYVLGYATALEERAADPIKASTINLSAELKFIEALLLSAGGDQLKTSDLTSELESVLGKMLEKSTSSHAAAPGVRKLDRDTLMSAQRSNAATSFESKSSGMDLDLLSAGRVVESRVDRKKLEKAERKIASKLAKREQQSFMSDLKYEASKLLDEGETNYDQFFLTINPLDLGLSAGKSKDIKLENIDLQVGNGIRILSDTNLTLSYGHRYGLVGANGIGKSTLLKALSRRELAVPKHITILYVEQEVQGDDRSALQTVLDADVWRKCLLRDQAQIQQQLTILQKEHDDLTAKGTTPPDSLDDEMDSLNTQLNDIFEKLVLIDSDKAESRAAEILFGLGFSKEAQAKPSNQFSGGWRMRLSLARALFNKPDLLMLDEPSNMLDLPSITFLSNYLLTYPSTLLVVSHDRAFLNDVATDIIYQHSERLDYYRGSNFDSFYASKEERHKAAVREYENQMAYRQHLQQFIDKFRYNAGKAQEAQSRIKKLEKLPVLEEPLSEEALTFKFPEPDRISPPVLQLADVSFGYDSSKLILQNVDINIDLDSRIALVGGNGSGKTTLLKLLMGKLAPTDGRMSRHPRLRIGYFAQHHIDSMDLTKNAIEWMNDIFPGKSAEEYRRLLGAFGIKGALGLQKMALLSGGQKSRVAFAALSLSDPHIMVLDEPSNHLDIAGLDALADALKNFKGGILMVSHDVTTIKRVCNEIYVTENSRVRKFKGTIDEYKVEILSQGGKAGVVAAQ